MATGAGFANGVHVVAVAAGANAASVRPADTSAAQPSTRAAPLCAVVLPRTIASVDARARPADGQSALIRQAHGTRPRRHDRGAAVADGAAVGERARPEVGAAAREADAGRVLGLLPRELDAHAAVREDV